MLLHAGAFGVLWWAGPGPAPRAAPPQAVELELVYLPTEPTAPSVPMLEVKPPAQPPSQPARKVRRPAQPGRILQEREERAEPEPAGPVGPLALETEARPGRAVPPREDVPRASPPVTLLPRNLPGGVSVEEAPSRGRTLRNLPGETPDPEALAAYQAEEAKARVEQWAAETLAVARARGGAVSPYFRQLQAGFAEQLVDPPPLDLKGAGARMAREQAEAIQRFGETGSPEAALGKREQRLERRNRLLAAAESGRGTSMYMVDVTSPVLALAAVVEVWQEPNGRLRDLKVLESSGDPAFDAWALSRLRKTLARAGSPPQQGAGLHDEGIRSRWRLEEYLGNPRVQIHLMGVY